MKKSVFLPLKTPKHKIFKKCVLNMQNVRHIAQIAGHTAQDDSHTMQNVGRTMHNVLSLPLFLKKLSCLEMIFITLGTKK